ncbi:YajQ family cyclic di-GMP-binding protein [Candidatus Wirthbacteria bacterium CG2_30_54_11]|uniref:Nucleotide-binding protein AUK40_04805 n=1 Tax=Candidatus Wirthbacteria bacterium CG2_30_54_11 TaxID=1817892 RepID=A0A1J5ITT7_9BACT|nr:MAG: YajQ family cyclic di-GMP-binding protein [Candidatus Wirthbacteria bacterium CG2_30_54_11]
MASESSFDIVSEFDRQELVNAIDIALREITNRFDLKDSKSTIELGEEEITVNSVDEYKLNAVVEILFAKAIKRNLSAKIFDRQKVEPAASSRAKQVIKLRQGLTSDQCRELNKIIREKFKKVKTQIQGDTLRISDKSKDSLQDVIVFVRGLEFESSLQCTNYR